MNWRKMQSAPSFPSVKRWGGGGGGLNLSIKLFKISGCSLMEPCWRILTVEWFLLVFIGICVLRTKLIEIVGWQPYLT